MFRRERPQKGGTASFTRSTWRCWARRPADRRRNHPDAHPFLRGVGLGTLDINSLGCPDCRPSFREKVILFLAGKNATSATTAGDGSPPTRCGSSTARWKPAGDHQGAPLIDFSAMPRSLRRAPGNPEPFDSLPDQPRMVRGLDYYTRTAFEVTTGPWAPRTPSPAVGDTTAWSGAGRPEIPASALPSASNASSPGAPARRTASPPATPTLRRRPRTKAQTYAFRLCNRRRRRHPAGWITAKKASKPR